MSSPRISYHKIIISGSVVESFQYARPIGYSLKSDKRKALYRKRRELEKQETSQSSLSRTKNRLTRKINTNSGAWLDINGSPYNPQFLTFTFEENIIDLTTANTLFTNAIKRMNYHYFSTKKSILKSVTVPEFQKRGAVHYHSVFFNLPPINHHKEFKNGELAQIWKHGFIKTKKISDVPNVGLYMTKYLSKAHIDKRLVGRKKYFSSRNLIKSIVISQQHIAEEMNDYLTTLTADYSYMTKSSSENHYSPENPTFCATYYLSSQQLQQLKWVYTTNI